MTFYAKQLNKGLSGTFIKRFIKDTFNVQMYIK